ncbi:polysaccharide deacetylase family protein [Jejudonia soesokkakensis]|uniref:Polysaccharide deacetylase family protein n=1 Tax=Jejudonia soesokkakensis TaxID=1323432 RepID=A0ABW2MW53_9FLAO
MLTFKHITIFFILLFVGSAVLGMFVTFTYLWYFALITAYLLFVGYGSFTMSSNFFLKAFTANKSTKEKVVALTFDDGPHPEYTPFVLQLLKNHKATATFFCIGRQVEKYPEIVNEIKIAGHTIGNHTYSHSIGIDFNSTQSWIEEIKQTNQVIQKIIGEEVSLFRPPYGVTTPHLAKAIEYTRHKVIGWNIRSFDKGISDPEVILKRIKKQLKPGGIILLHDTHINAPYILEHLLVFLRKLGYKTVSVNQLLDEK